MITRPCKISGCVLRAVKDEHACEKHWGEYTQLSKVLMNELNSHKEKEGSANINWNNIDAQYIIPMGIPFMVGKVQFMVTGIKSSLRQLTIKPTSALMRIKKADIKERYARLIAYEDKEA